jgi:hypothetical protein
MDYPESLCEIVKQAASNHRDDIDLAVDCAFRGWKASEEFAEWTDAMVRGQLRNMIHDSRHTENTARLKLAGAFGGPAKVGVSDSVSEIARLCYLHHSIAGRTLGSILGSELAGMAKGERERAAGCAFNANLCERLLDLVPADKRVDQVLSEAKVAKLFRELRSVKKQKRQRREAAVA